MALGAPAVRESAAIGDMDWSRSIVAAVDASPLESWPFDHIEMENVFPPALYARLVAALPERSAYGAIQHKDAVRADGSPTRYERRLEADQMGAFSAEERAIWLPIADALRSPALQDAFKRKFRRALENRFELPIAKLDFSPKVALVRDLPGYRISIHSDAMSKAITVQFYLPRDDSQRRLGTIFHEGETQATAREVKRMQFLPARGYAFAVVKRESWHSVGETTEADGERNSLMLTYYVRTQPETWLKSTKRQLKSLVGKRP